MVNICLLPSKKTQILPCPMFYVPCSMFHALCAFFPRPLVLYVLCVPCPVSRHILCTLRPMPCVVSSHVLWSHMFCVSHVLCLTTSYALYVPCPVCFLPMSFGPICFVCPMSCVSPCPMHSTFPCPMCQIPAISESEATCNKVGLL